MLPDVVDEFMVANPCCRAMEPLFFSCYCFCNKLGGGLSAGISTMTLQWVTTHTNTHTAALWQARLKGQLGTFSIGWGPSKCSSVSQFHHSFIMIKARQINSLQSNESKHYFFQVVLFPPHTHTQYFDQTILESIWVGQYKHYSSTFHILILKAWQVIKQEHAATAEELSWHYACFWHRFPSSYCWWVWSFSTSTPSMKCSGSRSNKTRNKPGKIGYGSTSQWVRM